MFKFLRPGRAARRILVCAAFAVFALARLSPVRAQTLPPAVTLHNFEIADSLSGWQQFHSSATLVPNGIQNENQAVRVQFENMAWPSFLNRPATPQDWSSYSALAFDVKNTSTQPLSLGVRVDDDASADGTNHCRSGSVVLAPGESNTYVFPLASQKAEELGMRALPIHPDGRNALQFPAWGSGTFNTSHIVAWQFFLNQGAPSDNAAPASVLIDNVRLLPNINQNLDGLIDKFGQYARESWPGKLTGESEFAPRRAAEEKTLDAWKLLSTRSKYDGWKSVARQKATGFFRSQKIGDNWWLIDPEGYRFFSTGLDTMVMWERTFTTGREHMFQWLPAKDDAEWGRHYSHISGARGPLKEGDAFSFYNANLQRKYGVDFSDAWTGTALKRLRSWGFNTIGNWSEDRFFTHPNRTAYVVALNGSESGPRIATPADYWSAMYDSFDENFEANVRQTFINSKVGSRKDDPYLLGYYVDNELSWGTSLGDAKAHYALAYAALALSAADSPAKRFFIAQLKTKYTTIETLNAAWKSSFADWSALDASYAAPENPSPEMQADLSAFLLEHARAYFRKVRNVLKQLDPNHLYLGCRFAWYTPEAVQAASEYSDVVSFNIYQRELGSQWDFTKTLSKPCIVGEFHFGALDRGMFHTGLVSTKSQADRAASYEKYVRSVLRHPAFVGAHWFQYIDEPTTGRSLDGENYNIGMVDITDTPYPELTSAAKKLHAQMYEIRNARR